MIAVATLEASQKVSGTRQALTFMLCLSTLGTGLLYVVMEGGLARFQPVVFAVVVTGGLYFIFREPEAGFVRLGLIEERIKRQQGAG